MDNSQDRFTQIRDEIKQRIMDHDLACSKAGISQYDIEQHLLKNNINVARSELSRLLGDFEASGLLVRIPAPLKNGQSQDKPRECWHVRTVNLPDKRDLVDLMTYLLERVFTTYGEKLDKERSLAVGTSEERLLAVRLAEERCIALDKLSQVHNDLACLTTQFEWIWKSEEPVPLATTSNEDKKENGLFESWLFQYFNFVEEIAIALEHPNSVNAQFILNLSDRLLFSRLIFPNQLDKLVGRWRKVLDLLEAGSITEAKALMVRIQMRFSRRQSYAIMLLPKAQGGDMAATRRLCYLAWPMIRRTVRQRRHQYQYTTSEPMEKPDWELYPVPDVADNDHPDAEQVKDAERDHKRDLTLVKNVHRAIQYFDPNKENLANFIVWIGCRLYREPAELMYIIKTVCTPTVYEAMTFLKDGLSDSEIEDRLKKNPIGMEGGTQKIKTLKAWRTAILRGKERIQELVVAERARLHLPVSRSLPLRKYQPDAEQNRLMTYFSDTDFFWSAEDASAASGPDPTSAREDGQERH